jgi:hypothetical protein
VPSSKVDKALWDVVVLPSSMPHYLYKKREFLVCTLYVLLDSARGAGTL